MKEKSLTQKGFSVLEVLVALGILGVVSLFGAKIIGESGSNVKKNLSDTEVITFLATMNRMLVNPTACEKNFVNQSVNRTMTTGEFLETLDEEDPDNPDANKIIVGQPIGPSELVSIEQIQLERIDNSSFAVVFNFIRNFKGGGGLKSFSRRLQFFAQIDGTDTLQGCFGLGEGVTATAQDLVCQQNIDRGVFVNNDDGTCRRINISTLNQCDPAVDGFINQVVVGGANHVCAPVSAGSFPPGNCGANFMVSFDGSGNPNCQSLGPGRISPAFGSSSCSGENIELDASGALILASCN